MMQLKVTEFAIGDVVSVARYERRRIVFELVSGANWYCIGAACKRSQFCCGRYKPHGIVDKASEIRGDSNLS